jgi:hypothetical protein
MIHRYVKSIYHLSVKCIGDYEIISKTINQVSELGVSINTTPETQPMKTKVCRKYAQSKINEPITVLKLKDKLLRHMMCGKKAT